MKKQSGFTFVETLVVLVILSITFGSGYIYFNGFTARQSLDKSRESLSNQIKLARMDARANRKPPSQVADVNYVKVLLSIDGIMTVVSDVGNTYSSEKVTSSDVLVSSPLTNCDICFDAGSGSLVEEDGSPKAGDYQIAITLVSASDTGSQRSTVIDASGIVDEISDESTIPTVVSLPTSTPTQTPSCSGLGGDCLIGAMCSILGGYEITEGTQYCDATNICCGLSTPTNTPTPTGPASTPTLTPTPTTVPTNTPIPTLIPPTEEPTMTMTPSCIDLGGNCMTDTACGISGGSHMPAGDVSCGRSEICCISGIF